MYNWFMRYWKWVVARLAPKEVPVKPVEEKSPRGDALRALRLRVLRGAMEKGWPQPVRMETGFWFLKGSRICFPRRWSCVHVVRTAIPGCVDVLLYVFWSDGKSLKLCPGGKPIHSNQVFPAHQWVGVRLPISVSIKEAEEYLVKNIQ
jgi:hypothetical protein